VLAVCLFLVAGVALYTGQLRALLWRLFLLALILLACVAVFLIGVRVVAAMLAVGRSGH
jgi:hypothetical protein